MNYNSCLEETMNSLSERPEKAKLFLHVCCAPCLSVVLERLSPRFDICLFFYNPNIDPEAEYLKRLAEIEKLLAVMPCSKGVNLHFGLYDTERFRAMARGRESEREGGSRCRDCIALRLEESAWAASEGGFEYFCTTLTTGPRKGASLINTLGSEFAIKYGVRFLPSDFKKKDGYKRSVQICAEYGIYRQNYCGCQNIGLSAVKGNELA